MALRSFLRATLLVALTFLSAWTQQAIAQQKKADADGWVTLGRFTMSPGVASWRFGIAPNSGRFNASRLVVVSGTLDLARVIVGYTNGTMHYEDRVVRLGPGERMARMDERDELREIEFVQVVLQAGVTTLGPVVVEIGGILRAPGAGAGMIGAVRPSPAKKSSAFSTKAPAPTDSAKSPEASAPGPTARGGATAPTQPSAERRSGEIGASSQRSRSVQPQPSPQPQTQPPTPPPVVAAPAPATAPVVTAPAPSPAPVTASRDAPKSTGIDDGKPYTAVPVFFGTDRKREADRSKWGRMLAAFSGNGDTKATWGRAVVSVPKEGREKGEIRRPEWDLFFTTVSLRKEDLSRDFVLLNVDVLDRASFISEVKSHAAGAKAFKDQAFVFVHGYRVSFDDALFRAAQITHDMGFDGLPFVYSWPSSAGVSGYLYDERRALGAREPLRAFLDMVVKESGAKKVHLIAHSMGAQALLEVLRDMRNIAGPVMASKPVFNEVILAAPDVTRDNFEQIAQQVRGLATGMTLYASANDKALRLSQKLSGASAGQVSSTGPLVVSGVDSIDVSAASTDFFSLNHSTFADRSQLLDDMRLIFEAGVRPPDVRAKSYTPVTVTGGMYWKFEKRE
jgi:esterase/lipase superfamily enzyme